MAKMMSYNEKSIYFFFPFFSLMGQGKLNFKFREFSGLKSINLHVPEEIDFLSWKFGVRPEFLHRPPCRPKPPARAAVQPDSLYNGQSIL